MTTKLRTLLLPLLLLSLPAMAQTGESVSMLPTLSTDDGTVIDANGQRRSTWGRDTSGVERTVPTEFFQWRIDERLGTVEREELNDTLPHGFQRVNATDGMRGEYTMLGNLGSPRLALNALDRERATDFMFMQPYSYFHTSPSTLLYTNTKSPLTNLSYHECGNRQNGQDRFRAYFATNIDHVSGIGFLTDYLYARGYYNNQANSQFGATLYGYHLGDRYQMHAYASWEHLKMGENGGIEDDAYITNPQSFPRSYGSRDIPTVLSSVWNRNDQQTYYLTHRYNLGFEHALPVPDSLRPAMPDDATLLLRIKGDSLRTVLSADTLHLPLTLDSLRQAWQAEHRPPTEFVPVASIVHTAKFKRLLHDNYSLGGIPSTYFDHDAYLRNGIASFTDETVATSLQNTLALQLREGFARWAQADITIFATHEWRRFRLPSIATTDTADVFQTMREHHLSLGGDIARRAGRTLHYGAGAELWVAGPDIGDWDVHGSTELRFPLLRDTVTLAARAALTSSSAPFYYRHYHSQTLWWDNDLHRENRSHIEGTLTLGRTHTSLRIGAERIYGYTYLSQVLTPVYAADGTTVSYYTHDTRVRQHMDNITVLSATLSQDLHAGIFHWENQVTWQHTSDDDRLPLPAIFLHTNPYIAFIYSKVLRIELGMDMRYYTRYHAPDYAPFIGQFAVQDATRERTKIGHYPILDAYVNFAIKRVRAYVSVKHFNQGTGHYFWAPHYPVDPMSIHLGISWNFYD